MRLVALLGLALLLTPGLAHAAEERSLYVASDGALDARRERDLSTRARRAWGALAEKARRRRGAAERFSVSPPAMAEALRAHRDRRVRVRGSFDDRAGTVVVERILSPVEVTFTGEVIELPGRGLDAGRGLLVDGQVHALGWLGPGLDAELLGSVGETITVRGLLYTDDRELAVGAVAARLTVDTTTSRALTEHGAAPEESPLVNAARLSRGTRVWAQLAHPCFAQDDLIDLVSEDGQPLGMTYPDRIALEARPAASPGVGLTGALERRGP